MAKKPVGHLNAKKIALIFIGGVVFLGLAFVLWVIRPLPAPLSDGSGSCIIRGDADMPEAGAFNLGKGYAKLPKPGIQTIEGLQSVCSKADYERLAVLYCLRNSQPYQEEVATYKSGGDVYSSSCGAFGCDDHYCWNFTPDGLLQDIQYLLFPPTQQNSVQQSPTSTNVVQYSPIPLPPPPHTTYTSDKLGISFTYINTVADRQNFFTKEIGDTVYLYYNLATNKPFVGSDAEFLQTIAPGAFSVEVFTKDPNLSLADAIRQRFLTGYSEADCFINTNYEKGYPREVESFETATISIHFPIKNVQDRYDRLAKCPRGYTEGGDGILYFMMDTKQPDKLLFVKIGQSNIPSGEGGLMWDGTIKIF